VGPPDPYSWTDTTDVRNVVPDTLWKRPKSRFERQTNAVRPRAVRTIRTQEDKEPDKKKGGSGLTTNQSTPYNVTELMTLNPNP
jgi:hypothetical protein